MLKHARHGNTLTVRLDGELDQYSAIRIRQDLDDLIADTRVKRLILDLQGLTFMDSSGIGVIIGRYRTLLSRGGSVAVCGESPHVQRIMQLSGLYQIIEKTNLEKAQ